MEKADKGFDIDILKRLIGLANKYPLKLWSVVLVALILAIVSILRAVLTKPIIDDGIIKNQPPEGAWFNLLEIPNIDLLTNLCLVYFFFLIAETLFQYFFILLANVIAQNVVRDIRDKLFSKIIRYKLKFYDVTPNGVLVTRTVSDIETIAQIFNDGLLVILGDLLRVILVIVSMFMMNWRLALIVIVVLPMMIIITRYFQAALKKVYQNERSLVAKLNTFVQERITGMSIVQIFVREDAELKKFKSINSELKNNHLKTVFYFSLLFPVVEMVSSFAVAMIIYFSGWNAIGSPGEIAAFVAFIQMLVRPLRQIAERITSIQRGLVSSKRVFHLMEQDDTIQDTGNQTLDEVTGKISFKNVSFSYVENEKVLKNINLEIKPGENLAIVGSTGAGKTTIINLLSRFYDINEGEILLDNTNIRSLPLEHLRDHIVTVTQDVFLFNSSIIDNVKLGNEHITEEEVLAAAKSIDIHNFIMSLPHGYHTAVSERGRNLSVGQRQLISFLRAYLANPEVLVLDEATSSIDSESELLIQKATEKITKNRTSIIIAHRLATIKNADRILVMDQGEIIEQGTHQELLEKGGVYQNLYEIQFAD